MIFLDTALRGGAAALLLLFGVLLVRDAHLTEAMRRILRQETCPDSESFDRLRSAGLITGNIPEEARPRCRLYAAYLRRHLGVI